ncbi:MoaD/ThiS family protein [Candidatus Bathyarchaeota archaeon]|nr:MoaD/ThiS family protein [Candidatus Bathyarchaeota archaeon]
MTLTVKFLGSFKHICGRNRVIIDVKKSITIKELILKIVDTFPSLKNALIDPELEDPRPNTLIIINGKEISVLEGLNTLLKDGDEVVFVPVLHGG